MLFLNESNSYISVLRIADSATSAPATLPYASDRQTPQASPPASCTPIRKRRRENAAGSLRKPAASDNNVLYYFTGSECPTRAFEKPAVKLAAIQLPPPSRFRLLSPCFHTTSHRVHGFFLIMLAIFNAIYYIV